MNTKAEKIIALSAERIGDPYVYGAWGELCIPANRRKRVRSDHPATVDKCQVLKGKESTCDGCRYIGRACYDCRGFTYCMLRTAADIVLSGQGASSQYNNSNNWDKRGTTAGGLPDCICCVFKYVSGKMIHTGLHIGGGRIRHCSVEVREDVIDKTWTHWAIPKGLYTQAEIEEMEMVTVVSVLKRGSKGDAVKVLQRELNSLGCDCGEPDGKFGSKTELAVRKFQKEHGLTVDGVAGSATQTAIRKALGTADSIPPVDPAKPEQPDIEEKAVLTLNGETFAALYRLRELFPELADAIDHALVTDGGGKHE